MMKYFVIFALAAFLCYCNAEEAAGDNDAKTEGDTETGAVASGASDDDAEANPDDPDFTPSFPGVGETTFADCFLSTADTDLPFGDTLSGDKMSSDPTSDSHSFSQSSFSSTVMKDGKVVKDVSGGQVTTDDNGNVVTKTFGDKPDAA